MPFRVRESRHNRLDNRLRGCDGRGKVYFYGPYVSEARDSDSTLGFV